MKHFLAFIIIWALVLTAPFSFSGDNCPDFRPDCSSLSQNCMKGHAAVVQLRADAAQNEPLLTPCAVVITRSFPDSYIIDPSFPFRRSPLHGRAPPHLLGIIS